MSSMPKIDLVKLSGILSEEDMILVKGIVATQGKNKGCLRASKPKVTRTRVVDSSSNYGYRVEVDPIEGQTAYVWRMVAFMISPKPAHHCMPCTVDFDLPVESIVGSEAKAMRAYLDWIVDVVVDSIPMNQWHGIRRWGNVLGVVGTPRYNDEGAVIYR